MDTSIVKKVILEIDGKAVELSLGQAEQLYMELRKLFGTDTQYIYVPQYIPFITQPPITVVPTVIPNWQWYSSVSEDKVTYTWGEEGAIALFNQQPPTT